MLAKQEGMRFRAWTDIIVQVDNYIIIKQAFWNNAQNMARLVQGQPILRSVMFPPVRRLIMERALAVLLTIVIMKNNIISVSPNRGHVALYAKTLLTFLLMCHKIISVMQKLLCFFTTTTTTTPLGV